MTKNEEIISFVDSNLKLEGMPLLVADEQTLRNCLSGRTTFDKEVGRVLAGYKRTAV